MGITGARLNHNGTMFYPHQTELIYKGKSFLHIAYTNVIIIINKKLNQMRQRPKNSCDFFYTKGGYSYGFRVSSFLSLCILVRRKSFYENCFLWKFSLKCIIPSSSCVNLDSIENIITMEPWSYYLKLLRSKSFVRIIKMSII